MSFASGLMNGIASAKTRSTDSLEKDRVEEPGAYPQDKYGAAAPRTPGFRPFSAGRTPSGAAPAPGASPMGAAAPAGAEGIFNLLDRYEGGGDYRTLFSHANRDGGRFGDVDVTGMTIRDVLDFSNPSGEYGQWVKGEIGRVATPMGRHQIVGTTLRNNYEKAGLTLDTPFDQNAQDTMFRYLADQRLSSADSMAGKLAAFRQEWDGFRHVPDDQLAAAIRAYEVGRSGPMIALGAAQ